MHGITSLLLTEYDEASILERIDDTIGDYLDVTVCEQEYNGDITEWYSKCGNGKAEEQVLTEILQPYSDTLDPDEIVIILEELTDLWALKH